MYEVAKSQKEKKHQKAYEAKKAEEEKELAECTFQPRTHANPDTSPTKQPLTEPKGYKVIYLIESFVQYFHHRKLLKDFKLLKNLEKKEKLKKNSIFSLINKDANHLQ